MSASNATSPAKSKRRWRWRNEPKSAGEAEKEHPGIAGSKDRLQQLPPKGNEASRRTVQAGERAEIESQGKEATEEDSQEEDPVPEIASEAKPDNRGGISGGNEENNEREGMIAIK